MDEHDENAPSGARRWTEAEIEVARMRQLLQLEQREADPDLRVLARVMNRAEAGWDAPDGPRSDHAVADNRARSRGRRPLVLASAALLIVLIVIAASALRPRETAAAMPPPLDYPLGEPQDAETGQPADAILAALADSARSHANPQSDHTVQYIAGFGWYLSIDGDAREAVILPMRTRLWVGADGSVLSQQDVSDPLTPEGTLDLETDIETPPHMEDVLPAGAFPQPFAELPDAPQDVLTYLRTTLCPVTDQADSCLLQQVADLASTHVLTPEQLAAIWDALAAVPGVRFLGETTDRAGRTVVALTASPSRIVIGETAIVLLADPGTGEVLGVEQTTLSTDAIELDSPAVTGFTTITDSRLVAALGES